METLLLTFFPQRQTLMHPEAVLFVDDNQCQTVELNLFLENCMGTDNHLHLTAGDGFLLRQTRFAFLLARQPAHFNAQRCEPAAEVIRMLFSQ